MKNFDSFWIYRLFTVLGIIGIFSWIVFVLGYSPFWWILAVFFIIITDRNEKIK